MYMYVLPVNSHHRWILPWTTRVTMSKPLNLSKTATNHHLRKREKEKKGNGEDDAEECDVEAWDALSSSFRQVQTVLDHNRKLIQQVNENHQSKIAENLAKNVDLIREINGNISKVISIYSDLSVDFTNIVQKRSGVKDGKDDSAET
ncbi:hypothetical protein HS088_TW02G00388 [Tripterygium wilfordii]|uniref:Protein EARLY FLOWERING 4 domain-containing protein n=2 Tax=Tripterygium wilfordii TaxID=458696 RepID=A0A7J7DYC8_TRIWF|nr:hypothetical protein HS088_TW02G00388 [Tripterygium wilfordii]